MESLVAELDNVHEKISQIKEQISKNIVDKEEEIHLCLCAIFSQGHLLLEGQPGVGKTSLVKSFSQVLGLDTKRIQFTNDLLPADIMGTSIFDAARSCFHFHKGPLFAHFVLADEINRATPKTQSALLEAMEEGSLTVDGVAYPLPQPFFVFATQNPQESAGSFPLPESQLDRFLMRVEVSNPGREQERKLLMNGDTKLGIAQLTKIISIEELNGIFQEVEKIHVSDLVLDYILDLVELSRKLAKGLSPRAAQDFLKVAKSSAYIEGRDFVIPEDVQRVAVAVMNHRMGVSSDSFGKSGFELAKEILDSVAVDG